jgi:pilus assembly protein Flp/PilA
MQSILKRFYNDENGATAIEYGLIAAIIGVGIAASVSALSGNLTNLYAKINTEVSK